ncbi:MAG TPA: glycosyltransferase family 39 protein [Solirubrobacteraceae bacterium]|nr:glycosyltransferase family 39 protein [Solirubrobacteraceae bacterium]
MEVSQLPVHARRRKRVVPVLTVIDARFLFAGIVALALALRLVAIGQHWGTDDGYSWLVASSPNAHVFLARLAAYENTPPLSYLVLALMPTGHSAWILVPAAVAGTLACAVLYYALRGPLGSEAALIAALALAVAPFHVSFSNLSRGFMLADLALLVALWAVLVLSRRESRRWWGIYLLAGVIAIYTEYDSAIVLLALTVTALWLGAPTRARMAVLGPLPLLAIVPWIPEIVRGQEAVGKTKLATPFSGPSPGTLRELTASLAFGANGGTPSVTGQWLEFTVILAVGAAAVVVLRRTATARGRRWRYAVLLIAGTAGLTLIGHAIAPAVGIQLFTARYLTIMIPLAAALAAAALVASGRRWLVLAAVLALVAAGAVNLGLRYHHQWEPDLRPVRVAAIAMHPRTVLTDNPDVVYYLGSLHPQLDRPFNLGPGRAASCPRPCLIIDSTETNFGVLRQVSGTRTVIGTFVLTLEP